MCLHPESHVHSQQHLVARGQVGKHVEDDPVEEEAPCHESAHPIAAPRPQRAQEPREEEEGTDHEEVLAQTASIQLYPRQQRGVLGVGAGVEPERAVFATQKVLEEARDRALVAPAAQLGEGASTCRPRHEHVRR